MKSALLFLVLACIALPAWSQSPTPTAAAKPALPDGPLLRPPADFSRWETTFTYSEESKKKNKPSPKNKPATTPAEPAAPTVPPDERTQKIITTKTGRLVHEERTDAFQKVTDSWYEAGAQYTKSTPDAVWYRSEKMIAGTTQADPGYRPLPTNGYRGMDLVNNENYAGTALYENQKCLVFVPGGSDTLDLSDATAAQKKLKAVDTVAFVAEESRLPVAAREHGELRVFQFDPPPTAMQKLPADLVAQIKTGEDARARLNQPASRPY